MTMSDKRHVAFYAFFTVEQSPLPLELFFFFTEKSIFSRVVLFFWGGGDSSTLTCVHAIYDRIDTRYDWNVRK